MPEAFRICSPLCAVAALTAVGFSFAESASSGLEDAVVASVSNSKKAEEELTTLLSDRRDAMTKLLDARHASIKAEGGRGGHSIRLYWKTLAELCRLELALCQSEAERLEKCKEFNKVLESVDTEFNADASGAVSESSPDRMLAEAAKIEVCQLLTETQDLNENGLSLLKLQREHRNALKRAKDLFQNKIYSNPEKGDFDTYLSVCTDLAESELKLCEEDIERTAGYARLMASWEQIERVAFAKQMAGIGTGTSTALAAAGRVATELTMHESQVNAGQIEDPDDARLKQLLRKRWCALSACALYRRAVWSAGVDMRAITPRGHMSTFEAYLESLVQLANSELTLCSGAEERVRIRHFIVGVRKRAESLVVSEQKPGATDTVAQLAALADRLGAEAELLRERIEADYWERIENSGITGALTKTRTSSVRQSRMPLSKVGLSIRPSALDLGAVQKGRIVRDHITVTSSRDFRILEFSTPDPRLSVACMGKDKSSRIHLVTVTFSAGTKTGRFREEITLRTDWKDEKPVQILVFGEVRDSSAPDLIAKPPALTFGFVRPRQIVRRTLQVSSSRPFRILDMRGPDERFSVTSSGTDRRKTVSIVFSAGPTSGRISGDIVVRTDLTNNEKLRISVTGEVLDAE